MEDRYPLIHDARNILHELLFKMNNSQKPENRRNLECDNLWFQRTRRFKRCCSDGARYYHEGYNYQMESVISSSNYSVDLAKHFFQALTNYPPIPIIEYLIQTPSHDVEGILTMLRG